MIRRTLAVFGVVLMALFSVSPVLAQPRSEWKCSDGRDNDRDGFIDCADHPDCDEDPFCSPAAGGEIYTQWLAELTELEERACVLAEQKGESGVYACDVSVPISIDLTGRVWNPPKGGIQQLCLEFQHNHALVPNGGYEIGWNGSCELGPCQVSIAAEFLDPQYVCEHTLGDVTMTATTTIGATGTMNPFLAGPLVIYPGQIEFIVKEPGKNRTLARCLFNSQAELHTSPD